MPVSVSTRLKGEAAMKDKLMKLIDVKSLITLILAGVYGAKAVFGDISPEQLQTVFTTVIAFYFGTQYNKNKEEKSN